MESGGEEDDYFLKWAKHHSAFVTFFSGLFRKSLLVDCTLAAEDKYIKAHRIVLMACSPYFEELLSDHCDNFPIVFVNIKFTELKSIIDYCYRGEVKVSHDDLDGFLNAANMLRIRGLSDNKSKSSDKPVSKGHKRRRSSVSGDKSEISDLNSVSASESKNSDKENIEDSVCDNSVKEDGEDHPTKKQKVLTPEFLESLAKDLQSSEEAQGSDCSDVDTDDDSESSVQGDNDVNLDINELLMQATGSLMFPWSCNRCGQAFASKGVYREHRQTCREVPFDHSWSCENCSRSYKNKKDLVRHLNYCGREQPRLTCERCAQTYKYDRGLKRHQEYCGKTDVELLKCPDCDKTYKYKRGLRRHQRKCTILRALNFLQKKGVAPPVPPPPAEKKTPPATPPAQPEKQPKEQKEKAKKALTPSSNMVCSCGKSYKYVKSFKRHRMSCRGNKEDFDPEDYDSDTNY